MAPVEAFELMERGSFRLSFSLPGRHAECRESARANPLSSPPSTNTSFCVTELFRPPQTRDGCHWATPASVVSVMVRAGKRSSPPRLLGP